MEDKNNQSLQIYFFREFSRFFHESPKEGKELSNLLSSWKKREFPEHVDIDTRIVHQLNMAAKRAMLKNYEFVDTFFDSSSNLKRMILFMGYSSGKPFYSYHKKRSLN